MSNNRQIAGGILNRAKEVVTSERGQQHGSAQDSFRAIGEMWVAYLNQKNIRECGMPLVGLSVSERDVAFMMAQMKMIRVVWGDETQVDNYVDGAGYFSLAGMFGMPDAAVVAAQSRAAPALEQAVEEAIIDDRVGDLDPAKPDIPNFLSKKKDAK